MKPAEPFTGLQLRDGLRLYFGSQSARVRWWLPAAAPLHARANRRLGFQQRILVRNDTKCFCAIWSNATNLCRFVPGFAVGILTSLLALAWSGGCPLISTSVLVWTWRAGAGHNWRTRAVDLNDTRVPWHATFHAAALLPAAAEKAPTPASTRNHVGRLEASAFGTTVRRCVRPAV